MKKTKTLKTKIAEDICELNCWRTPKRIKKIFKRELTEDELRLVMDALETYVPSKEWLKIWRSQDIGVK